MDLSLLLLAVAILVAAVIVAAALRRGGSAPSEPDWMISRRIEETLKRLDVQAQERNRRDEELIAINRRVEAVFRGSGKGRAGEFVLEAALQEFPQDMVARDLLIKGGRVEFALRLPDGSALPIDAKVMAGDLLIRIESGDEPDRARLVREVSRVVDERVRAVSKYLDPPTTANFAVAALPDAVFPYCNSVHAKAMDYGVHIIPYSLTIPYLLLVYRQNMLYSATSDLTEARQRLTDVGRSLSQLERILPRFMKAARTTEKAYRDATQVTSQLRSHATAATTMIEDVGLPTAVLPPEAGSRPPPST